MSQLIISVSDSALKHFFEPKTRLMEQHRRSFPVFVPLLLRIPPGNVYLRYGCVENESSKLYRK